MPGILEKVRNAVDGGDRKKQRSDLRAERDRLLLRRVDMKALGARDREVEGEGRSKISALEATAAKHREALQASTNPEERAELLTAIDDTGREIEEAKKETQAKRRRLQDEIGRIRNELEALPRVEQKLRETADPKLRAKSKILQSEVMRQQRRREEAKAEFQKRERYLQDWQRTLEQEAYKSAPDDGAHLAQLQRDCDEARDEFELASKAADLALERVLQIREQITLE